MNMKYLITPLVVLLTFSAVGQETPEVPEIPEPVEVNKDTSEVKVNGNRIIIIKENGSTTTIKTGSDNVVSFSGRKRNHVFQGFEIGFTGVSYTKDFNTSLPENVKYFDPIVTNSINWSVNPFELDVRIIDEYVKFSTGLGYNVKNFTLANNYRLYRDPNSGITTGEKDPDHFLTRNRFRTAYITVPAMLQFNTNPNPKKSFRIGAGALFGVKIFEAYRLKYNSSGSNTREKYNSRFNANPYLVDLRGVIGFGTMNFYGTYSLNGLFKDNLGPEVYPFTVGVAFVPEY
jgi:hypothetical protein